MRDDRYYRDVWQGEPVALDREYRGHRLSERECAALFRGRTIEIHGLKRHGVSYSIECGLEKDPVLEGVVHVKSLGTVGANPDYSLARETSPFRPHGPSEEAVSAPGVDADDLDRATQAMILDGADEGHPGDGLYVVRDGGTARGPGPRDLAGMRRAAAGTWAKALGMA